MTRPAKPGGKLSLFEVLNVGRPAADDAQATDAAVPTAPRRPTDFDALSGRFRTGAIGTAVLASGVTATAVAAFFIGRYTSPASVADADDVRPEVLDVAPVTATDVTYDELPLARLAPDAASLQLGPRSDATPAPVATAPSMAALDAERVAGLNYLLVQSYHPSERAGADATVMVLRDAGIDATVETGIRGWGNYWCVVGTEPFKRRSRNPELDAYTGRVLAVGREASRNRLIKAFDPQLVQWGR